MTNSKINQAFFNVTDSKTQAAILSAVAKHYGISQADAMGEVIGDEAEHLLDYLTGSVRVATSVIMQKHGLAMSV